MPSAISDPAATLSRAPQRQRGRERVAGLMAAASALFVDKGFDATTMTQIAARAGASIGALYLFFPTKSVMAQTLMSDLAEELSARIEALRARANGSSAAAIADALFDELLGFLAAHPVYAMLLDVPGEDGWKGAVRARRRIEIAALFASADPPLPPGQAERLAVIVPQLMRITMTLSGETPPLREAVLDELRTMLRRHLAWEPHA